MAIVKKVFMEKDYATRFNMNDVHNDPQLFDYIQKDVKEYVLNENEKHGADDFIIYVCRAKDWFEYTRTCKEDIHL